MWYFSVRLNMHFLKLENKILPYLKCSNQELHWPSLSFCSIKNWELNISTNFGKSFFNLLGKHFPKADKLHKYFNLNNVKVSYSSLSNFKKVISGHNKNVVKKNLLHTIVGTQHHTHWMRVASIKTCVFLSRFSCRYKAEPCALFGLTAPKFQERLYKINKAA